MTYLSSPLFLVEKYGTPYIYVRTRFPPSTPLMHTHMHPRTCDRHAHTRDLYIQLALCHFPLDIFGEGGYGSYMATQPATHPNR